MYLNGMGFRAIARVTEINHTTIINWVEQAGKSLSDEPQEEEIPEITEIDELQTYVGNKKNRLWIWTVVNHKQKGILLWNIGDCEASRRHRSHETFEPIWQIIKCWKSFWYVTDGWKVYPMYIEPEDHLVCKTYMTRVEGENTRLRHCALERTDVALQRRIDIRRLLDYIVKLCAIQNRLFFSNILFVYCYII